MKFRWGSNSTGKKEEGDLIPKAPRVSAWTRIWEKSVGTAQGGWDTKGAGRKAPPGTSMNQTGKSSSRQCVVLAIYDVISNACASLAWARKPLLQGAEREVWLQQVTFSRTFDRRKNLVWYGTLGTKSGFVWGSSHPLVTPGVYFNKEKRLQGIFRYSQKNCQSPLGLHKIALLPTIATHLVSPSSLKLPLLFPRHNNLSVWIYMFINVIKDSFYGDAQAACD